MNRRWHLLRPAHAALHPEAAHPLAVALALGVAAYAGAQLLELGSGATWVIAIIAVALALGANLAGIDYLKDHRHPRPRALTH